MVDLDDRIEEVQQLILQRQDIDERLSAMLGVKGKFDLAPKHRKLTGAPRCAQCGKSGHDIQGCPDAVGKHPNNKVPDGALTPEQYGEVRSRREWESTQVAEVLDLPLGEVNRAFIYKTYDAYLRDFKD